MMAKMQFDLEVNVVSGNDPSLSGTKQAVKQTANKRQYTSLKVKNQNESYFGPFLNRNIAGPICSLKLENKCLWMRTN